MTAVLNFHQLHMFSSFDRPNSSIVQSSETDYMTAASPLRSPFRSKSEYSRSPQSSSSPSNNPSFSNSQSSSNRHRHRESFSASLSGGFRTLIVDDNLINLNILERTLKRHFSHLVSPNIAVASSGSAALSQLSPPCTSPREDYVGAMELQEQSQFPFDLILLDIDMPGLSGVQVAEQIRNVHNDQATAIVAVTTSNHPEQQRTYEQAGMDGCVGKPIDLGVLDRVVTRALLARRPSVRPRTSSVPPMLREPVSPFGEREIPTSASAGMLFELREGGLQRRLSFPLSLEEFNHMREAAAEHAVDDLETDSMEQIDRAVVFQDGHFAGSILLNRVSRLIEYYPKEREM